MNHKKRIVIVGATSEIAQQCARLWLHDIPVNLTLVGRNLDRIARVAADLRVRSLRTDIQTVQADFLDPTTIQATVDGIFAQGPVDIVLIAQGSLPDQSACQEDIVLCRDALEINGISPVLYAEAFAKNLAKAGCGTLALIGSVAGDRGRKSNYTYGAAKGMLARYAQGLQHRFAGTGVTVILIKPGPTDTPMTAHLRRKGEKLALVEDVAKTIVDSISHGKQEIYTPTKWRIIMLIIQHIPAIFFNKLNI